MNVARQKNQIGFEAFHRVEQPAFAGRRVLFEVQVGQLEDRNGSAYVGREGHPDNTRPVGLDQEPVHADCRIDRNGKDGRDNQRSLGGGDAFLQEASAKDHYRKGGQKGQCRE